MALRNQLFVAFFTIGLALWFGPQSSGFLVVDALSFSPFGSTREIKAFGGFIVSTDLVIDFFKKLISYSCLALVIHNCCYLAVQTASVCNSKKHAICYLFILITPLCLCLEAAFGLFYPDSSEYILILLEFYSELGGMLALFAFLELFDTFNSTAIQPTPPLDAGLKIGTVQYIPATMISLLLLLGLEAFDQNGFWIKVVLKMLLFVSEQVCIRCIRLYGSEARQLLHEFHFFTMCREILWVETLVFSMFIYYERWGIEEVATEIFHLSVLVQMVIMSSLQPYFYHPASFQSG